MALIERDSGLDNEVQQPEILGIVENVSAEVIPNEGVGETAGSETIPIAIEQADLVADEVRQQVEAAFTSDEADSVPAVLLPVAVTTAVNTLAGSTELMTPAKPASMFGRAKAKALEILDQRGARMRPATEADIPTLVKVDIEAFDSVYKDYGMTREELQQDLETKFAGRLEKVGGDWIQVFERDGQIAGFIACCPTNKDPKDFVSWEETTDQGTLETTYDPEGKYVYVVSLSMTRRGSSIKGHNMLFGDQIGKFVAEGYKTAFFESRMPGLRGWVTRQCRLNGTSIQDLSPEEVDAYAHQYFGLTTEIDGKQVPQDRLLRTYAAVGCDLLKVVPDAYQDVPSMNYGVVCTFTNPLPEFVRKNRTASKLIGNGIRLAAKSRKLSEKIF